MATLGLVKCTYRDVGEMYPDTPGELIDGEFFAMHGASTNHQSILANLLVDIGLYLRGKKGEVFCAPFDVFLFAENESDIDSQTTYVEPDLLIVCDPSQLVETGCIGAPNTIIEILSESTNRRDRLIKMNLYSSAGVQEYWIVDPEGETVEVYLRNETGVLWINECYSKKDTVRIHSLDNCVIDLNTVFS